MRTIVFILLTILISCKEGHHDHKHHALPASAAAEGSLFDLEDMWTTQDNKMFHWKDQKGVSGATMESSAMASRA